MFYRFSLPNGLNPKSLGDEPLNISTDRWGYGKLVFPPCRVLRVKLYNFLPFGLLCGGVNTTNHDKLDSSSGEWRGRTSVSVNRLDSTRNLNVVDTDETESEFLDCSKRKFTWVSSSTRCCCWWMTILGRLQWQIQSIESRYCVLARLNGINEISKVSSGWKTIDACAEYGARHLVSANLPTIAIFI